MDTGSLLTLVFTIVAAAIGATWVLGLKLSSISSAISSLVARVDKHDAEIIDIKKARGGRRPR